MFRSRRLYAILSFVFLSFAVLLSIGSFVYTLRSQTAGRELIREKVDSARLVTLAGNTRPEANAANDLGVVSDDLRLDHMMLQAEALAATGERTVERGLSPSFTIPNHPAFWKWLTAGRIWQEFRLGGVRYPHYHGLAQSAGLQCELGLPERHADRFFGQCRPGAAGVSYIHSHGLNVNGVRQASPISAIRGFPEALAPAVAGIVSMHNFRPHKMSRAKLNRLREYNPSAIYRWQWRTGVPVGSSRRYGDDLRLQPSLR